MFFEKVVENKVSEKNYRISETIEKVIADNINCGYYPFGMQMPGRKYTQAPNSYRYGFNGKENDNEVKGEGNQQDYGFRIYDPRIGKFLSVDPLTKEYPFYSPYHYAGNTPIQAKDLDGLEPLYITNSCFAPYDLFGIGLFGGYVGDGENRKYGDGGTHRTSGTSYINLTTYTYIQDIPGNTTSVFRRRVGPDYRISSPSKLKTTFSSTPEKGLATLTMHVSGPNKAALISPDIDNHVNISFMKTGENKFLITGSVTGDRFPSNETIISDKYGTQIILGVSGPNGEKNLGPLKNLPGDNNRKMSDFSLSILFNSDESFKGVEQNGKTYSPDEWSKIFKHLDPKDIKTSTSVSNKGIKTKKDD